MLFPFVTELKDQTTWNSQQQFGDSVIWIQFHNISHKMELTYTFAKEMLISISFIKCFLLHSVPHFRWIEFGRVWTWIIFYWHCVFQASSRNFPSFLFNFVITYAQLHTNVILVSFGRKKNWIEFDCWACSNENAFSIVNITWMAIQKCSSLIKTTIVLLLDK